MARRSVQWRQDFSFTGDPPTPMARRADADDRRALPPRRPPAAAAENRLAPRAGEEDFRWLQASTPGSPESGSSTPSPQLWAQHPRYYDRLYPASAGSSPSRAQAIAGYRREMLDLVRGLPEAAYELSLRDIVESRGPAPLPPPPPPPATQPHAAAAMHGREGGEPKKHVAAAAMPMDDEQAKKQSGGMKQRTMGRTRSRSMERSVSLDTGLLIKLFMPLSVGRKKKVSPKPAGDAKEGRKKTKKGKKKKKAEEEEWWKKSEFSEAGSSSRTSSTGSSSNSSASRNGNVGSNAQAPARTSNPQAPARSRSRKRIGCYGFFRPNKGTNAVIEE